MPEENKQLTNQNKNAEVANPVQTQVQAPSVFENLPQDAVSADFLKLKGFIGKVKQGIKEKRELSKNGVTGQPAFKFLKGNKALMFALIVFIILVVFLVAAALFKSLSLPGKPVISLSPPTPVAIFVSPSPESATNPSRYATDSGVLDLEKKILELDKNMSATEIRESTLTPPALDFDVNLK